jgi:hypothetical protein
MIRNIRITLANNQKYKLREAETLSAIDGSRTALFLLDNLQVYYGCSDGEVDDEGDFCISLPGKNYGIAVPFGRLLGWAYKRKGDK